jgi:uncharacterized protein YndB with AHSA1/START domain
MNQPVLHGSFTVERDLAVPPDYVFQAFANPELRKRWFRMPSTAKDSSHELDFRVGGHERASSTFDPSGTKTPERLSYNATFIDIAENERLVFTYDFTLDGIRRWTSLVTVELQPQPDSNATRLIRTEQYAYLAYTADGHQDLAHLKGSAGLQLNALAAALTPAR